MEPLNHATGGRRFGRYHHGRMPPPPDDSAAPVAPPVEPFEPRRQRFWTPLRVVLVLLLIPALVYAGLRLFPSESRAAARLTPTQAIAPLRDAALATLRQTGGVRGDGYIYAVDIGQLATFAALAGDRELYEPLRRVILEQLLVRRVPGDPAHGMIAWRFTSDAAAGESPVDASGTTEALRAAEALHRGQLAFPDLNDRETIALILDAYARHAAVDSGTWMIRNYFNLDPRVYAFSTNSFLVDYDPDLVAQLAEARERDDWREVAEKSVELIRKCRTPAGLLHQMIRPEVRTIMPALLDEGIYSANGIEQLNNVLTVAERCVETDPQTARQVLEFCRTRLDDLRLYYDAATGAVLPGEVGRTPPGAETWGPLLRLAVKLDDQSTADHALRQLLRTSHGLADDMGPDRQYLRGEALLALQYAVNPPGAARSVTFSRRDPPASSNSAESAP